MLVDILPLLMRHTEVTITGNDSMIFDNRSFNTSAGSDFRVGFKNIGKLQVAMSHICDSQEDVSAIWTSNGLCMEMQQIHY